jgi:hypothetical protein
MGSQRISPRDKRMLRQLESLRKNRLMLAELNTAKAKRAAVEAAQEVKQAVQALAETVETGKIEQRRLNAELSMKAISKKALDQWRRGREALRVKEEKARTRVADSRAAKAEKERELQEAKKVQRDATMDIERLDIMRDEIARKT